MATRSHRYPRYHLIPATAADRPWSPVGSVDPQDAEAPTDSEIDLTAIDVREAQGAVTQF